MAPQRNFGNSPVRFVGALTDFSVNRLVRRH
jgi:hypothetical protein